MKFIHTDYPAENEYPKLVRDGIPEIIKKNIGVQPKYKVLKNNGAFLDALLKKMVEESVELQHSLKNGNLEEELADIFEIIDTIIPLRRTSVEKIVRIQKEKRKQRGGFDKRILMLKKAAVTPPKLQHHRAQRHRR